MTSSWTSATTVPACIPTTAIASSRLSTRAGGPRAVPSAERASDYPSLPSVWRRTAAPSSSCATASRARISACGCRCVVTPTRSCARWPMRNLGALLLLAALAGCAPLTRSGDGREAATSTVPDARPTDVGDGLGIYLQTLRSLIEGDPVVQADVFRGVAAAADS